MLATKNLSPQQLSLYTAAILSAPITLGYYLMHPKWWVALLVFIIIFSGSFLLIQFTLEQFIYRKIKLIYKFIYQTKASKREETYYKYVLPQKSIDEVREDVEKWATQQKEEIEVLRTNEAYRKEFLQNLAHEFKTPIFAVQGYVDTLLDGALENPAVSKKFLENAARNVARMVTLVSDLDEITKLESGEQASKQSKFCNSRPY
ncbi:MAG: histidine kinase dimerization/phospho-acceptor domain-containing protein [Segetibacter sp.]